jgi:hypothetical protein
MSNLNAKQRKLVYLGGIVLLLIPVIALGMPATGKEGGTGGKLYQLRQQYELGESTLGDVDPSGTAANLVLLGLRGPAVTTLWMQAVRDKETKNWARLRSTVNSIITLQPHFKKIWRFQGWNLAYNVSAEWDAIEDRYYWVKEGINFTKDGARRNKKYAELPWELGRLTGDKIGESDEWRLFRKYFQDDPDPQYDHGPDPTVNPEGKDNFLVARDHYLEANERELINGQNIMMRMIFRSYPAKSFQEYANVLQKEGNFQEEMRLAWESALEAWTEEYGQEEFDCEPLMGMSLADPPQGKLKLEADAETMQQLADANKLRSTSSDPEKSAAERLNAQAYWTDRYQKMVHYNYWRKRALVEHEELTVAAHREIYRGKQLYREGKINPRGENGELPSEAREVLESGMTKLQAILRDPRFVNLQDEDEMLEEAMLAVMYWRKIHQLNGLAIPADYPLKWLWDAKQEHLSPIQELFRQESRGHS